MELTFRADPSTTEWLHDKDATLCVEVLRALARPAPRVLEIGVWKGAWTITMAGNVPDSVHVGIDPYPGGSMAAAAKQQALAEFGRHRLSDRIRIVPSWDELHQLGGHPEQFDLIHIDGRHTQEAVEHDLDQADHVLADDGVIVVDDYRLPIFPGIAFAMYRFLERRAYRIFLVTENKAYLARASAVGHWHGEMERRLASQQRFHWIHNIGEDWGPERTTSSVPDVLGSPILLCVETEASRAAQVRLRQGSASGRKAAAVRVLRDWLPPVAFRALVRGWGHLGRRRTRR